MPSRIRQAICSTIHKICTGTTWTDWGSRKQTPLHQAYVQMPSSTRTSITLWKRFSAPFDAMRIAVQVRYDARATRGNSSKGVWTLFILVIMNYWGNTQGETANAKNQWGDADKLGNGHASVYAYAAGPSPQQGMLLHLPPLRAGCLPFGRTMGYDLYAKCSCRPAQKASRVLIH